MTNTNRILYTATSFLGALLWSAVTFADAQAKEADNANNSFSWEALTYYVAQAHSKDVSAIRANFPQPTTIQEEVTILITDGGIPVISYVPKVVGKNTRIGLSFSCNTTGTVNITALVINLLEPETRLDKDAPMELFMRPYGGPERFLPVTILNAQTTDERFIQVHGALDANDPFLTNLAATTNFQLHIKQNDYFQPYNNYLAFPDFNASVKPLLQHCRGETTETQNIAVKSSSQTPASFWTPSALEIQDALQRRADDSVVAINRAANACDQVGDGLNPLTSVVCLFGAAMQTFGKVAVNVRDVTLDECVRAKDGVAFCRYDVDAVTELPEGMSAIGNVLDGAFVLGGWVWGSYAEQNGRWEHQQTFKNCNVTSNNIRCEYQN